MVTRWYVGIGKDKDGRTILPDAADIGIRIALSGLSRRFGGATVIRTEGGWIDAGGRLITEKSIILEVIGPCTPSQANNMRDTLTGLFNQSSVLVVQTTAEYSLI